MNATAAREITLQAWLNIIEPAIAEAAQQGRTSVYILYPRRSEDVTSWRIQMPGFVYDTLIERGFELSYGTCVEDGMHIAW